MSTFHDGDGVIPGEYRVMLSEPAFRGGRTSRARSFWTRIWKISRLQVCA